MPDIPIGYCQCGCGNKTNLVTHTNAKYGHIKGNPMKYLSGHYSKTLSYKKYRWRRINGKLIQDHILIAEKVLGESLPIGAQVHHVNGDCTDNRKDNLVICQDNAYHHFLHRRMRAYNACGHADWRKCMVCKKFDSPDNIYISPDGSSAWHRDCINRYHKELRLRKKQNACHSV